MDTLERIDGQAIFFPGDRQTDSGPWRLEEDLPVLALQKAGVEFVDHVLPAEEHGMTYRLNR
jgi:hypothetical protein